MKNILNALSFVPKPPVSFQPGGSIRMIGEKVMFQTLGFGNPTGGHCLAKTGQTLLNILTWAGCSYGQVSITVVSPRHINGRALPLISGLWIYAASPKTDTT